MRLGTASISETPDEPTFAINDVDAADLRREPAGPRSPTRRRANVFAILLRRLGADPRP